MSRIHLRIKGDFPSLGTLLEHHCRKLNQSQELFGVGLRELGRIFIVLVEFVELLLGPLDVPSLLLLSPPLGLCLPLRVVLLLLALKPLIEPLVVG